MSPSRLRRRKLLAYKRALLFIGSLIATFGVVGFVTILLIVKLAGPPAISVPQTTQYLADDLSTFTESHGAERRYWVPLSEISPYLVQSTLAVEDRNFYHHNGFDTKRIIGAIVSDTIAMAKVQGASTITQQYAKNLFLGSEKTWSRKAKEALYTLRIEDHFSKDEILEGYLNTIYYGHGMYGIQAASHYYFHKDAKDLSLAEASMLAGIPKGPGIYSPLVSEKNAKERQAIVLDSLKKTGQLSAEQVKVTRESADNLTIYGSLNTEEKQKAPYFLDAVNQELRQVLKGKEDLIRQGGLKVYTTFNSKQQAIAEEAIAKHAKPDGDLQAALVAMNPHNGMVKALVGGNNYEHSPFNRATQALRQPGSTIKPLLYYTALEKGFTPSTTLRSEVTTFSFDGGKGEYTPHNFNNRYANDSITMAQALAVSDNIFAVKTHLFLGEEELVKAVKRFGLTAPMDKVPSLALGTSGVKPLEMTNAYNLFANGGKKVKPYFITKVTGRDGEVLYKRKVERKAVLKQEDAYVMTQMLTGVFDKKLNGYASVTGASIAPKLSRPYAGKSGSTEYDSWMIGYTPQLTTGVWTGYDRSQKIETKQDKIAAKEIWASFMEQSLKDEPVKDFKKPKNIVAVEIDPESGLLAHKACPVKRLTYYKKGTEPKQYCANHINRENTPAPSEKKNNDQSNDPWYKKIWPFGKF